MAKINSGNKPQIQPPVQSPIQSGQSAKQVSKSASVAQTAPADAIESQAASAKPAASSPLSATLMAGLSAVADRYYGSDQVAVNPRLRASGEASALDAQAPSETIALKADSLARKTGIPAATAQEIVKLATYILS